MSASFDQQFTLEIPFDSNQHLRVLCEGSRVEFPMHLQADYPVGWKAIVEDFIKVIRRYPVRLNRFDDMYGELDIRFELLQRTREVQVWRAVDDARMASRKTCMRCGGKAMRENGYRVDGLFCRICIKHGGEEGTTGTWLDKY